MLGVIGGSGFYTFFGSDARSISLDTPYGAPSAPITVGSVGQHEVAFLPRHGVNHEFSPHAVPYRANMWALRALGVRRIFGPCAVGSLTPVLGPGAMVVPDQLVDRTSGRADTYFDSGGIHVAFADPYCPTLRAAASDLPGVVDGGTMVVIQGPRFSTRAESRWFASQGFTLVNMTGYPEAVLARELEMCYAAIALVTDLDAGIETGEGVRAVDVFARVRAKPGAVQEAGARGHRPGRIRADLHPLPAARGRRVAVRSPVRILLTGAAGFIGARVDAALRDAGHDVVAVDAMLATAHGPGAEPPPDCQVLDIRDAAALAPLLAGVDVVCHQAAVVGAGVNAADAPSYGSHNDYATAVLLAEMFAAGCRKLVLASSMVVYGQGRYDCPEHGPVDPLPRTRADLNAGVFEHRCPIGGEELQWRLVGEDAPLRPRSLYAASKTAQEHYALAWAAATGGSVVALRYHNVYGPFMPRDTPYSGVAAIFRSELESGDVPRVFEDGGQMRDFVHVDDVAAANVAAVDADLPGFAAFNVCSGRPISIMEVATELCDARGDAPPVVTGQYRSGDVRHIVADPARAASVLGFRAAVDPRDGLREFAFAPLRG